MSTATVVSPPRGVEPTRARRRGPAVSRRSGVARACPPADRGARWRRGTGCRSARSARCRRRRGSGWARARMAGYVACPIRPARPPLAGLRVLELGSFIAGPFAGQLLGDLGAEVIKVEPPGTGDPMRGWGVTRRRSAASGGRRSRATSSRSRSTCAPTAGRDLVRDLTAHVDVVIENFKPGTLARWGMDYATLAAANPALVLVHVSGLRPDRTAGARARLRCDRRGDGRHPAHHRRSRPAAGPRRHLARRRAGGAVRGDRDAGRGATSATPRVGARRWTSRSTRRCSR